MDITIEEIARLAGVSRGTVDRVVHNRGRVSRETEERVRRIIEEQKYEPNTLGRAFALSRKNIKLGVLLSFREDNFLEQIMQGVTDGVAYAEQHGFEVMTETVRTYSPQIYAEKIRYLGEQDIACLALTGLADELVETELRRLRESGVKIVTLNTDVSEDLRDCFVGQDNAASGKCAAFIMKELCGESGKILMIGIDSRHRATMQRLESFRSVIEKTDGLECTENRYCSGSSIQSYQTTLSVLDDDPDIKGIFVSGAGLSGACRAVYEKGLAGKVKIIGFDMIEQNMKYLESGAVQFLIDQEPYVQDACQSGFWLTASSIKSVLKKTTMIRE